MTLWHLGSAAAIVYLTLGRRRIDYRFILLGAILPDLFDAAYGAVAASGAGERRIGHTLLAVLVLAVIVIVGLRGERRLALFGVPVGWLLHLVTDGMWDAPRTFFWPAFGTAFDAVPEPYAWEVLVRFWEHPGLWGMELVGGAILVWFWVAFRLGERERFRLFLRDGYLRP